MSAELLKGLRDVSTLKQHQHSILDSINTIHTDYSIDQIPDPSLNGLSIQQSQLESLYKELYSSSANELQLISSVLEKVQSVVKRRRTDIKSNIGPNTVISNTATGSTVTTAAGTTAAGGSAGTSSNTVIQYKPRFNRFDKGDIWSHDSNSILAENSSVAALVDANSRPNIWIQATVISYKPGARPKYAVLDLDEGLDETNTRKVYTLDARKIVPMPPLTAPGAGINRRAEFKAGDKVLAVFPENGVTALYPATVNSNRKKKSEYYFLSFEDDEVIEREVHIEKVIPYPQEWEETED